MAPCVPPGEADDPAARVAAEIARYLDAVEQALGAAADSQVASSIGRIRRNTARIGGQR